MKLSRRHLLISSTALPFLGAPQPARSPPPWQRNMRRCRQVNFNQQDPQRLDIASWVDYWSSLKLDALLLNAGGIVAFYPTRIPYHHRSPFLGGRDLFGDLDRKSVL